MKKLFLSIILLLALGSVSSKVYAQFGLGRSLENAINRNIEKKIDQAVDEAFENEIQKQKKNKAQKDSTNVNANENGSIIIETNDSKVEISGDKDKVKITTNESDVAFEQTNELPTNVKPSDFIGSFDAEISMYKNNQLKDKPLNISYFIDTYQVAVEMQPNEKKQAALSIFDRQKGTMTMLQEEKGKKTAMVMKMPKITVKTKNNETPEDAKFTKTGRTKIIDGHTCYEYVGETEKQKTTFWVAPNLKYNLAESMQIMQSQNKQQNETPNFGQVDGMPLEVVIEYPSKNERMEIKYKNLKIGSVNKAKFSTNGYEVTDMTQFGGMFGK